MGVYSALMSRDLTTFRKGVPGDIRPLVGQREIKVSLRNVAQGDRPQILVELDRLCVEAFTNARSGKGFALPSLAQTKAGVSARITTTPVTPSQSAPSVSALLSIWKAQNPDASPSTLQEWERVVRYFTDLFHDVPADKVTKNMVLQFRDTLRKLPKRFSVTYQHMTMKELLTAIDAGKVKAQDPLTDRSINKYLAGLGCIFELARKLDILPSNPVTGLKFAARHTVHDRKAFSPEELQIIFTRPIFAEPKREDDSYWPLLLGLYTGARLSEILQLQLGDIKEQKGIWYLDVNMEEGKRIKTSASLRKIPLHQDVLNLGFIEHVQALRGSGQKFLFPESVKFPLRQYSSIVSKRLNRFIDQCGIGDNKKTFYSLRHTFKDIATLHDVPEDIREALMGHSSNKMNRNYGSGQFIERLNHHMQSLRFGLFDAPQGESLKVNPAALSISDIFTHTPQLEVQEVAEILAPQLKLAPSVLLKILRHQLSIILCETPGGEEPDAICSPSAFISETQLRHILKAVNLLT